MGALRCQHRLLGSIRRCAWRELRGQRVIENHTHTGRFNEVLFEFYRFVAQAERPYAVAGTMEYTARGR